MYFFYSLCKFARLHILACDRQPERQWLSPVTMAPETGSGLLCMRYVLQTLCSLISNVDILTGTPLKNFQTGTLSTQRCQQY